MKLFVIELNLRPGISDLKCSLQFPTNQVQNTKHKVQELNPISTKLNV